MAVQTVDDPESGDLCTQAIVEIEYEAIFTFEGTLPEQVSVIHDGSDGRREVASAVIDDTSTSSPTGDR